MLLRSMGHHSAAVQHISGPETKTLATTGGKAKPPRRRVADKQGPRGGWLTPGDKRKSWTCEGLCLRLVGRDTLEDAVECWHHMRAVQRSTRPIRTCHSASSGPVSTQPSRKGKIQYLSPPPACRRKDSAPKPTVLLSFVRSKASCSCTTGCPGRTCTKKARCPGKIHDKHLINDVLKGADVLGPGRLLYSIENNKTITFGDSPFWLPFLHISCAEPARAKRLQPDQRLKKSTLGRYTVLTQDLFEEHVQITLIEEDASRFKQSPAKVGIKSNDDENNIEFSLDPQNNESQNACRTSLLETQRLLDSDSGSCSSDTEDESDADSSLRENCMQSGVQDFTSSPGDYISFMPPRKSANQEKRQDTEKKASNSLRVQPCNKDHKFMTATSSPVISKLESSPSKTSTGQQTISEVEVLPAIEETFEGNETSKIMNSSPGTASSEVHKKDFSGALRSAISRGSLKFYPTSTSCQVIIAYKSLNNSTDRLLTQSWLKWTGCWDAFTMLVEETLKVKTITLYTSRGRCSKYSFPYIVIIDVLTPTDHEAQIVKSISQRLRVERWKGFCSVYNSLIIAQSSLVHSYTKAGAVTVEERSMREQLTPRLLPNLAKQLVDSQDSCSCEEEDLNINE